MIPRVRRPGLVAGAYVKCSPLFPFAELTFDLAVPDDSNKSCLNAQHRNV